MTAPATHQTILALDVGNRRVGVAAANALARLPRAVTTLERNADFWGKLEKLIADESADVLVVGMPRNLQGNATVQTAATREFIGELRQHFSGTIATQDEALTSRQAEAELHTRGKHYAKGDIDMLAAVYILEDYLGNTP